MSIAEDVSDCANTFRKLQFAVNEGPEKHEDEKNLRARFYTTLMNSFDRFQLWASNLGAHRRDRNSLDHRLREASHLQHRIKEYLKDLNSGLSDAFDIITEARKPWDELSNSSSGESDGECDEDINELDQLSSYISNTVGCLLRVSTVIQKPAPHDRFINSSKYDQSFRQPWDEQYVRDKFVHVPEWLATRLGRAITRRRQFLAYRKDHHQKIASSDTSNPLDTAETVVSSLPTVAKQGKPLPVVVDSQIWDGVSTTSYVETVLGQDTLCTPKIPDAAENGQLFECPCCYMIIGDINSKVQWKRHVFADLQPYICLHDQCISADQTFAHRHDWIKHDKRFHSTSWRCSLGCDQLFSSETDMERHFEEIHGVQGQNETHRFALSTQVQRETADGLACPLCNNKSSSLKQYYKHVARHLEQLALFSLPKEHLEDDEDDEGKEVVKEDAGIDEIGVGNERKSVTSGDETMEKVQAANRNFASDLDQNSTSSSDSGKNTTIRSPNQMDIISTDDAQSDEKSAPRLPLAVHKAEREYICLWCPQRFRSKSDVVRHSDSLHARRQSWSCAVLAGAQSVFYASEEPLNFIDICAYCGEQFPRPANWEIRREHLISRHKFGECNPEKKFFRTDHLRQHLRHSHDATPGPWRNLLIDACMREEAPRSTEYWKEVLVYSRPTSQLS